MTRAAAFKTRCGFPVIGFVIVFKLCRLFSVLLTLLLNVFCSKASVFPEAPAPPASLARLDFLDRTVRYDLLFALMLRPYTCTRFVVFVGFISQPAGIRR